MNLCIIKLKSHHFLFLELQLEILLYLFCLIFIVFCFLSFLHSLLTSLNLFLSQHLVDFDCMVSIEYIHI